MAGHQQFCPVALTAEVIARRWTPLVLRELLLGSVRFNDIHRGVPRMSRTLLSTRLSELESAGIVERRTVGEHPEYHLSPAGRELEPIIRGMGTWGKRWLKTELTRDHLDVPYLMWDIQRRVDHDALPRSKVVVAFQFEDAIEEYRHFWLVLERDQVDLCLEDPGFACDLRLTCEVRALVDVWLGDDELGAALRERRVRLSGPHELRRQFPHWLGLSLLAGVEREG